MLTLASGTAVAQLLLALAVPVLARLYTPAEYGVLAVYSSILTKSLRQEMGSRGRRRIEKDCDITRVTDELTRRFAAA